MLTETHLHDVEDPPLIPGFDVSFKASRPRNAAAAGYGGVAVYFKQELFGKISIWKKREKDGVIWICGKKTEQAVAQFFCCCYVAPDNCTGRPKNEEEWFSKLEKEISEAKDLGEVLVAGDFNARIGAASEFNRLDVDGSNADAEVDTTIMENDLSNTSDLRFSVDGTVSSRGGILLDMCEMTGLRVVNGRVAGDIPAAVTSLGNGDGKSKSVIDLFLACPTVFERIESLKVGGKLRAKSDHLAVTLTMARTIEIGAEEQEAAATTDMLDSTSTSTIETGDEYIIDAALLPVFAEKIAAAAAPLLEQICIAATAAAELKDADMLDKAVDDYNRVVSNACADAGMRKKGVVTDKDRWAKSINKSPLPIRQQARAAKRARKRMLRKCDIGALANAQKKLRKVTDKSRKARREIGVKRLERLLKDDPRRFYKYYRKPPSPTLVSNGELSKHSENLLGAEPPDLPVPPVVPGTVPPPENIEGLLQTPFSMEELSPVLKKIKNQAGMIGTLRPELLKASVEHLGPAIVELLNASVAIGKLPKVWALSAITPIAKPGSDHRTCDGYRGIAVGTLAAKLYGSMLDHRIDGWAEASGIRAKGQFGFRKGKGTASASFIVRTLFDQVRTQKGGRLYTCFVDFKKAYDSVPRHLLWAKLERRGVTGWVLDAIKAMYADVPMCVKSSTGLGKVFQSNLGVKQGCPLSPLLFGLYLDDWDAELKAASEAPDDESDMFDFPNLAGEDLRSLMYADDLMQAATSIDGLRKQMALLEDFSARWGLTINASKTKVMVFSRLNSPHVAKTAVLKIGGEVVEVVERFKYLGTIFHCSQMLSRHAVPARAYNGRRAYHISRRRLAELQLGGGLEINFRLFDVMVDSVLGYGAEVWAPELLCNDPLSNDCERVHLFALKWLLGVRKSTASCIVLAETGRWPLAFRWVKRIARFYNGLVKAPADSILKRAFIANCQLTSNPAEGSAKCMAEQSWAAQLQRAFKKFEVQLPLEEPIELNVNDVCIKWKEFYLNRVRTETGTKIKKYVHEVRNGLPEYEAAPYLGVSAVSDRRAMTQAMTGSHFLMEEVGRWNQLAKEDRVCKQCAEKEVKTVETAEHLFFHCPSYDDIRADFPCLDFTLTNLHEFSMQQPTQITRFGKKCFELHQELNPLSRR